MNILLKMAYHGGAYHGFQVQANAVSVCAVLQDAMQKLFLERPDVKGCSRTDAGVHAREYYLNFKLETEIADEKMPLAINQFLPRDIRVLSAQRVQENFHARYNAKGKEYEYVFLNSSVDDPFALGQYHRVYPHLNEKAMQEAAQYLLGKHDFAAFMSAGSDIEDTVRTITKAQVQRNNTRVVFTVAADGFLYNMVRIMAGTLLKVGACKITPQQVLAVLQAKLRAQAGETMPAEGLFLNKVFYDEKSFELL